MPKNRIQELRKAKGWTQQQLAEESGFTQPEIARWEKPKDGPARKTSRNVADWQLEKIASALGCDITELLSGVSAKRPPIKGYVGADSAVIYEDLGTAEPIAHPRLDPEKAACLEMRAGPHRHTLMYFNDEQIHGVSPRSFDKTCIVKIKDGGILLKRVLEGKSDGKFTLEDVTTGLPPINDAVVEWSMRIELFVLR